MTARPKPSECPLCEYDRRFPGFERGGWMQQDNNGPIVSCPMCNPGGKIERESTEPKSRLYGSPRGGAAYRTK